MGVSTRTHVLFDGLADPALGHRLSRAWADAGLDNAVDVSGQCAWLARTGSDADEPTGQLTEAHIKRAASIARCLGVEIRDRVSNTFVANNTLEALRSRACSEYRHRLAVLLMFGLPALALHYGGPFLTGGADSRRMALPWLLELLLIGWACIAAGWPILWQGALAVRGLRGSADMLTSLIMLASFSPSLVGVLAMAFGGEPHFGAAPAHTPMGHASILALGIALTQRWLGHRAGPRLSGHTNLMLRGFDRLVGLWVLLMAAVWVMADWRWALSIGMLLPPCLSLGAVNRWSPGWSTALPVLAFTAFVLLGPEALDLNVQGVQVEIAAGFGLIMTAVFACAWGRVGREA